MPQQTSLAKKGFGCLKGCLIALLSPILILAIYLFFATVNLRRSDEEVLKTYTPTPQIQDLADKNQLTDKGRATLYRTDPKFIDAETLVKNCQTISRGIETLACIAPKPGGGPFGGKQIFLLQIDDKRFIDHKYSASVHEMLHMAYDLLNSEEKKKVDSLLNPELEKHKTDFHLQTILETLKTLKNKKERDILSELHSKFGVEYASLSNDLEEYYKKYFKDRSVVVKLYQNGGFNSRVRRLDTLAYEAKQLNAKLTSMQSQLNGYKNAGNIDKYNSLVATYNNLVNQYNAKSAESTRVYNEIQTFYKYFNPDYTPSKEVTTK